MGNSHEHHVTPLSTYFTVFGSLIVLTFVTVGVSELRFAGNIVHHCCNGCSLGERYVGCHLVYALDSRYQVEYCTIFGIYLVYEHFLHFHYI